MTKLKTYSLSDKAQWEKEVRSFSTYDIYYLPQYVEPFAIHGDGKPILLVYQTATIKGVNVVMKRDLSKESFFSNLLNTNEWFDIVTPYGYGGWYFEGDIIDENLKSFEDSYKKFCLENKIVCEFNRYHPLLDNANNLRPIYNVIDLGKTISVQLQPKELIWDCIDGKCRNKIRKAIKNNVTIHHSRDKALIPIFMRIYNDTMTRDKADEYYFFDENFYLSIFASSENDFEIFYAKHEDKIIAMSIILKGKDYVHYHLSGSVLEYRSMAPTNLLLYEVAVWAGEQGYKEFHLGGGVGSGEDNLFKFKQAFNRHSNNQFSIGNLIFNQEMYNKLIEIRKKDNPNIEDSSFFPKYRSI